MCSLSKISCLWKFLEQCAPSLWRKRRWFTSHRATFTSGTQKTEKQTLPTQLHNPVSVPTSLGEIFTCQLSFFIFRNILCFHAFMLSIYTIYNTLEEDIQFKLQLFSHHVRLNNNSKFQWHLLYAITTDLILGCQMQEDYSSQTAPTPCKRTIWYQCSSHSHR